MNYFLTHMDRLQMSQQSQEMPTEATHTSPWKEPEEHRSVLHMSMSSPSKRISSHDYRREDLDLHAPYWS